MKKQNILAIIIIILGISLIVTGAYLSYNESKEKTITEEKKPENNQEPEIDENYQNIGAASLKEDKVFNKIKFTKNNLSTTDSTSYASFTSVIFNETGADIIHKDLEIDFYDASGNLLGTMESNIENLEKDKSTIIYGIVTSDLSTASSFTVREVTK